MTTSGHDGVSVASINHSNSTNPAINHANSANHAITHSNSAVNHLNDLALMEALHRRATCRTSSQRGPDRPPKRPPERPPSRSRRGLFQNSGMPNLSGPLSLPSQPDHCSSRSRRELREYHGHLESEAGISCCDTTNITLGQRAPPYYVADTLDTSIDVSLPIELTEAVGDTSMEMRESDLLECHGRIMHRTECHERLTHGTECQEYIRGTPHKDVRLRRPRSSAGNICIEMRDAEQTEYIAQMSRQKRPRSMVGSLQHDSLLQDTISGAIFGNNSGSRAIQKDDPRSILNDRARLFDSNEPHHCHNIEHEYGPQSMGVISNEKSAAQRRPRSMIAMDHQICAGLTEPGYRHSVHFNDACSGLETLDFPVRKKQSDLVHGPIVENPRQNQFQPGFVSGVGPSCACDVSTPALYPMINLGGREFYIIESTACCLQQESNQPTRNEQPSRADQGHIIPGMGLHVVPGMVAAGPRKTHGTTPGVAHQQEMPQYGLELGPGQTTSCCISAEGLSSSCVSNQPPLQPRGNEGREEESDMVLEAAQLWNGVSGVPGLGVSIASSSIPLDEWDNHDDNQRKLTNKTNKKGQVGLRNGGGLPLYLGGIKVELPRVLSPRSSSCRSSGRSTGSLGSSALSQGLSNGSSSSSGKYSRSDSVFSNSAPLPRIQSPLRATQERGLQRKLVNNTYSFKPDGNLPSDSTQHHYSSENQSVADCSMSSRKSSIHHKSSFISRFPGSPDSISGPSPIQADCSSCVCSCIGSKQQLQQRKVMFQDLPLDCCCSDGSASLPPMQVEAEKDHQQYGRLLESARVLGDHQQCGCISASVHGNQCGCIDDSVQSDDSTTIHAHHQGSSNFATDHYKSPREVDGDYSYAYSDSVSPAFLIRVGAAEEYNYSGRETDSSYSENIYEEINEANKCHDNGSMGKESRKSSSTSQDLTGGSFGTSKTRLRRAFEAVTRRSSRSLENQGLKSDKVDNFFHLSISKGRQKKLRDRARQVGAEWDCESPSCERSEKTTMAIFGEVTASHNRVMSQLKLDVEDMLMPPPSPPCEDIQDDSGFQSGGMSSIPSSSPKSIKISFKNSTSLGKSTTSQMRPGIIRKCESMDFCIDPYRDHRGDKLCEHRRHTYKDNPKDSWSELDKNIKSNMLKSQKKRDTVNNKYLSKLANLPLLGLNNHKNFHTHDNNNNKNVMEKEEDNGKTFYL